MAMGRPPGRTAAATSGPPIEHDAPGRRDDFQPGYCDSCKVPATTEKLLTFELRLHGKAAGEWTLCERCWSWRCGRAPLNPDPLYVPEDGETFLR